MFNVGDIVRRVKFSHGYGVKLGTLGEVVDLYLLASTSLQINKVKTLEGRRKGSIFHWEWKTMELVRRREPDWEV